MPNRRICELEPSEDTCWYNRLENLALDELLKALEHREPGKLQHITRIEVSHPTDARKDLPAAERLAQFLRGEQGMSRHEPGYNQIVRIHGAWKVSVRKAEGESSRTYVEIQFL